jgi:ATP-dependent RNA helicase RhlE
MSFQELNLISPILQALEKKGYTTPTPIQAESIPHLLEKKDLLGIAQTGTGKTAAFALPILNNLALDRKAVKPKKMRVLILTPTRELATQIADNIEIYGKGLGLKHAIIFGGVGENPQITALMKGLDIVVATPGRLLDLTKQGYVNYDEIEVFVLDEADRMLDMGFINDIKQIIARLPKQRQTLFFSATMPRAIADLAHSILNNPVRVEITPQSTTVEKIDQKVYFVEKSNKPLLLKWVLEQPEVKSVLVFCRMKHGANRVEEFLERSGIKAEAIHGNKSQSAREKALQSFRDGKCRVLVATDIAARGIDVAGVTHVINYDIPQEPESYVHRIGRTARAGREGVAISFCEPLERSLLKAVEKSIKRAVPVDNSHPYFGVEGQIVHRKISSGKSSGKQPVSHENRHGNKNNNVEKTDSNMDKFNSKPHGSRIISRGAARSDDRGEARRDGHQDRRERSANGHRSERKDGENRVERGERGERNNRVGDNNRSDFGHNKNRRDSRFDDRPRSSKSHYDRSNDDNRGNREVAASERPQHSHKKNSSFKSKYAKSTSKGHAFHANKKRRDGDDRRQEGGSKSKIGKFVNWFKGKIKN